MGVVRAPVGMTNAAIAYVFPGQGAQYVGMGVKIAQAHPGAADLFERASRVLGQDLLDLCRFGPEALLQQTANTQPAILVTSLACLAAAEGRIPPPRVAAGLSLGEYSALVCAGALEFEDAVRVVRQRGLFMQEATAGRDVAMAAILGLDAQRVEALCREVEEAGVCEPANYNAPGQTVIGGDRAAVERAIALAKQAGARRAVLLAVSAPFHTRLMRPAAERLAALLETVPIVDARIPVVANITAAPVQRAGEIRAALIEQVARPVRWVQSVERMVADGVGAFVELGPGTVLSGLIKRTAAGLRTLHVEDPASLAETAAAFLAKSEGTAATGA
ncbi:MAG: ACP S-malonyltransferase [Armatimonadota bacterium]|nr:ACP S-malonyltransferase [Armatimonadota bacterium]MDR5697466.1 ACP S-malonyltransferase [Armatimonadota bacterium]